MRAVLLGNSEIEREFTPLMTRYAKEFAPTFATYANAANPSDREAAALLVILNNTVTQPYVPVGFGRGRPRLTAFAATGGAPKTKRRKTKRVTITTDLITRKAIRIF